MRNEVIDQESGAIIFKEDESTRRIKDLINALVRKIDSLEERIEDLEYELKRLRRED